MNILQLNDLSWARGTFQVQLPRCSTNLAYLYVKVATKQANVPRFKLNRRSTPPRCIVVLGLAEILLGS